MESAYVTLMQHDISGVTSLTWEVVRQETEKDPAMQSLISALSAGFPDCHRTQEATAPYWQQRESLYLVDGVVMYQDSVVMPPSLR